MSYLVFDTENTVRNKGEESIGSFKANPYHPDNRIVYTGWKLENMRGDVTIPPKWGAISISTRSDIDIIVGHNIGHDIAYILKSKFSADLFEWIKTGHIWDTMFAEYLLSGQQVQMPSLDYCAEKYGGTLKDDKIKEYWNDGVETEDIPDEELKDYLKGDVENTERVFLCQVQEAVERGIMPWMWAQMDARLATIMMEFDGMYFDTIEANEQRNC